MWPNATKLFLHLYNMYVYRFNIVIYWPHREASEQVRQYHRNHVEEVDGVAEIGQGQERFEGEQRVDGTADAWDWDVLKVTPYSRTTKFCGTPLLGQWLFYCMIWYELRWVIQFAFFNCLWIISCSGSPCGLAHYHTNADTVAQLVNLRFVMNVQSEIKDQSTTHQYGRHRPATRAQSRTHPCEWFRR